MKILIIIIASMIVSRFETGNEIIASNKLLIEYGSVLLDGEDIYMAYLTNKTSSIFTVEIYSKKNKRPFQKIKIGPNSKKYIPESFGYCMHLFRCDSNLYIHSFKKIDEDEN